MTDFVISTEDHPNGEREGQSRYGPGDTVTVREGVFWLSETSAVRGVPMAAWTLLEDLDVTIDGAVLGIDAAVDLDRGMTMLRHSDVRIGETGFVGGLDRGIMLEGGRDNTVVNEGVVVGTLAAIRTAGGATIENHGIIGTYGDEYGPRPWYYGISVADGDARIENTGAIYGGDWGREPWNQAAIKAAKAARIEVVNEAGALIGEEYGGTAIMGGDRDDVVVNRGEVWGDIHLRGGADRLTNDGTLEIAPEWGWSPVELSFGSGEDLLENGHDGFISGEVRMGSGADRVENRGLVRGEFDAALWMGDGDDVVLNLGEVEGGIDLGDGDDVYHDGGRGSANYVNGGRGDDIFTIWRSSTSVNEEAGEGYDTVRTLTNLVVPDHVEKVIAIGGADVSLGGRAGADLLVGNSGDNGLHGWDGDDHLKGGRGKDSLRGGEGDDRLHGGSGDDVLRGGDGDDRLIGAKGGDRIEGGAGDDVFRWRKASEAGTEKGDRDAVTDFERGRDLLDLTRLDLALVEERFSGERAEVRIDLKKSHAFVRVDADGDGSSDMTIVVRGVTDLGADDLLL